jgi:hypothetical protein
MRAAARETQTGLMSELFRNTSARIRAQQLSCATRFTPLPPCLMVRALAQRFSLRCSVRRAFTRAVCASLLG